MKIGLNCEQNFDEWSREFEKNVTCAVVQLYHETSNSTETVSTMVHETMGFILEEAGMSPAILNVCEFLSMDDLSAKGGS